VFPRLDGQVRFFSVSVGVNDMKKKLFPCALFCCIAAASLWCTAAVAQFAKPEDAIKYRQSAYTLMAAHFQRIQSVIKGEAPFDQAQVKANVDLVKTLSNLSWGAFEQGTEGGAARPEIWSDMQGFKQAQKKFEDSVDKLAIAADSGDMAKLRTAFGETGASCKACHDSYRKKKN
jgi:cytochrome c556